MSAMYPVAIYGLVLVLVPLIGMLNDIMVWRNKAYIVTNRRVIQISGVFNKDVVDSSLEKVNDIKMSQSFLGRLFAEPDLIKFVYAYEQATNHFITGGTNRVILCTDGDLNVGVTSDEALVAAGLDWSVTTAPSRVATMRAGPATVVRRCALERSVRLLLSK